MVVFLKDIADVRQPKGKRHLQLSILVVMLMAMLCGKTSLKAIARFAKTHRATLENYIPLPRGKTPSYSTLQRTSHRLNIEEACEQFNQWMAQYQKPENIAVDGKSITSTVKNPTDSQQKFASLVSFFGQKSQLIYQIGFLESDKRSEINVAQELISKMQITKAIFTMDALHCQKGTVEKIINSGNGYVITVKQNQPNLHKEIKEKTKMKPLDTYYWNQTGHGHDARCRIKIWEADTQMKNKWKGLQSYISVRRQGIRDGKEFDTTTFYISSEKKSAWSFAQAIRGHRKIENTLHWTKDVVQNEDNCGLAKPQAAINMAVIRDISFNLLVMNGFKSISQGISAMGDNIKTMWNIVTGKQNSLLNNTLEIDHPIII